MPIPQTESADFDELRRRIAASVAVHFGADAQAWPGYYRAGRWSENRFWHHFTDAFEAGVFDFYRSRCAWDECASQVLGPAIAAGALDAVIADWAWLPARDRPG